MKIRNTVNTRIRASLIVHNDIMHDLINEGWSTSEASEDAGNQVRDMPTRQMLLRAAELNKGFAKAILREE